MLGMKFEYHGCSGFSSENKDLNAKVDVKFCYGQCTFLNGDCDLILLQNFFISLLLNTKDSRSIKKFNQIYMYNAF